MLMDIEEHHGFQRLVLMIVAHFCAIRIVQLQSVSFEDIVSLIIFAAVQKLMLIWKVMAYETTVFYCILPSLLLDDVSVYQNKSCHVLCHTGGRQAGGDGVSSWGCMMYLPVADRTRQDPDDWRVGESGVAVGVRL